MYNFNYHRPQSLADAGSTLQNVEDGKLLAGGMTLLPTLKMRLAQPSDLIDLAQINELKGICQGDNGSLVIGAMTTHAEVAASPEVQQAIPALAQLAGGIGDPQVRHRGTLGGSVANNDPAADYPAALLALNATVRTQQRSISADEFFVDMFETALDDGEILTAVEFPRPKRAAYAKFPNPASRYAMVGVMVAETDTGVRVAVTGAASSVFRIEAMEQALNANFSPDALKGIVVPEDNLNSDIHASADYRAHLIGVMARRAVAACLGAN
ncbi:MAG: xanthine dehydrogenase family protein subunit M [Candidatus Competibacteraceae bacterium]|nr:xanthine dehydrogenase family protein subunit M [Candidatus Competibacteraceae bacterium]MCB1805348.1 xanthine dehydrogenase family protein subunit M [Candidatus Competibacteraceae bacterium]MCB1811730.1 xanthine dehydrogenase family protein subunit M [Candidatus Competibacteraceae bacterium]